MATQARDKWSLEPELKSQPERDERGRFRPGSSGNARGRPRKPRPEPWNLSDRISEALSERVSVKNGDAVEMVEMRDLIIKSLIRSLAKARPREVMGILEQLDRMGALEPSVPEPEPIYTEEDRRLLEIIRREVGLE